MVKVIQPNLIAGGAVQCEVSDAEGRDTSPQGSERSDSDGSNSESSDALLRDNKEKRVKASKQEKATTVESSDAGSSEGSEAAETLFIQADRKQFRGGFRLDSMAVYDICLPTK